MSPAPGNFPLFFDLPTFLLYPYSKSIAHFMYNHDSNILT